MKTALSFFLACDILATSHTQAQTDAQKPASKDQIRRAVQVILDTTFQRAAHRKADGTVDTINFVLLYLTDEERKQVRHFGTPAINVLREYVPDNENWRQVVVLQLLSEFTSDDALSALVDFAEHSHVRYIAVSQMGSFPIAKTRPFLKKFSADPDPLVRDAAKRNLAANGET
jgi:HEAT repeat protein